MRTVALLALLMIGGLAPGAGAQNAPSPLEPLLKACRLLQGNKALALAAQNDATLTQKTRALNDMDVQAALRQARAWLALPAVSTEGALTSESLFDRHISSFGALQKLARVIKIEQYVLLSEGRTSDAIDSARDGLRIAYAVKPNSMVGWQAAGTLEALAVDTVSRRLDQMSLADCRKLLQLARDWTRAPDSTAIMLALERRRQKAILRLLPLDGPPQPPPDNDSPEVSDTDIDANTVYAKIPPEFLHITAAEWQALMARTEAYLDRTYAEYVANSELPIWEQLHAIENRKAPAPSTTEERFEEAFSGPMHPLLDGAVERHARQLALAHALGANAAIYAYRWEHNRLPDSLAALNLGELALDPFTGRPFGYKVTGSQYTLESVGPCKHDADGNIIPNARTPISLGPNASVFPVPVAPADKHPGS